MQQRGQKATTRHNRSFRNMRYFLSWLLLAFVGLVGALSSSGSRLLVVLEDAAEKDKYSRLWEDLECKTARSFSCQRFDDRRADEMTHSKRISIELRIA